MPAGCVLSCTADVESRRVGPGTSRRGMSHRGMSLRSRSTRRCAWTVGAPVSVGRGGAGTVGRGGAGTVGRGGATGVVGTGTNNSATRGPRTSTFGLRCAMRRQLSNTRRDPCACADFTAPSVVNSVCAVGRPSLLEFSVRRGARLTTSIGVFSTRAAQTGALTRATLRPAGHSPGRRCVRLQHAQSAGRTDIARPWWSNARTH